MVATVDDVDREGGGIFRSFSSGGICFGMSEDFIVGDEIEFEAESLTGDFLSVSSTGGGAVSDGVDGGMEAVDSGENCAALISREGDENDILDCFVGGK